MKTEIYFEIKELYRDIIQNPVIVDNNKGLKYYMACGFWIVFGIILFIILSPIMVFNNIFKDGDCNWR